MRCGTPNCRAGLKDPAMATLHGSSVPIPGSTSSARCASSGLHAPRMRYGFTVTPSLAARVALTSISVSTPKPSAFSASRRLRRRMCRIPAAQCCSRRLLGSCVLQLQAPIPMPSQGGRGHARDVPRPDGVVAQVTRRHSSFTRGAASKRNARQGRAVAPQRGGLRTRETPNRSVTRAATRFVCAMFAMSRNGCAPDRS